ncbi:MAG: hypothetical protein WCD80_05075, partial [Desulfobaccales bacterium]
MTQPDRLSQPLADTLTCPLCHGDYQSSESYNKSRIFSWWQEQGHLFSQKVLDQYRDFTQTSLM